MVGEVAGETAVRLQRSQRTKPRSATGSAARAGLEGRRGLALSGGGLSTPRPFLNLAIIGGLILVFSAFAVLGLSLASDRTGARALPDGDHARLEWLTDPGARLDVAAVAARPAGDWKLWDGQNYLVSARGEALWLRFTVRNPSARPLRGVLQDTEIYTDRVEIWSADRGSDPRAWPRLVSGESTPVTARPWWALAAAFAVEVPAGGETVMYLRETDYYYPQSWWRWWPRHEDYTSAQWREILVKVAGLGALAALWLYNLVLWARLRFADMGYYAGYAAGAMLFNFTECGGLALFGGVVGPPWRLGVEVWLLAISALFAIPFARRFLETERTVPRWDRVLVWFGRAWWIVVPGALTSPWTDVDFWLGAAILGTAVTHVLLMGTALVVWRRGHASARYFVPAFGALMLCGLPAAATWSGGGDTHFMVMVLLMGWVLEMLLLSFALADRFARTQQQLVAETEQRRAIEESYRDELELEVRERTKELAVANADKDRMLTVVGHDLRGPLTGLMRVADGDKGEVAQEVTRTVGVVLLLIEDLVLWARLRAGARHPAVHPAQGLAAAAVALHRTQAELRVIALTVAVPAELHVRTDLVLAQTLVRNLLANALKFAETRVVLRAEPVAAGVRFTIGNDGPPLPPAVAARFASGENEPITATGGLGLRLCREICAALDTQLAAGSAPEGGTEFSFTLPRVEAAARENHS